MITSPGESAAEISAWRLEQAMGGLSRLTPTSLRDEARRAIRAGIIAGKIEAGEVISVRVLADRLGVSATPVREAVLSLAKEGLLVPIRNKGFEVPTLSDQDLQEILEVRLLLEVPAVVQVSGRLPPGRVVHYRTLAGKISEYASEGDVIGFLEADGEFHLSLLAELGNHRLVDMVALLRDQVRLYGLPHLAEEHQLTDSAEEHSRILDSIIGGDSDLTGQLIRRHLERTRGIWAGRGPGHDGSSVRP
jgi:DNA-binding GntR family transcriptional regulator